MLWAFGRPSGRRTATLQPQKKNECCLKPWIGIYFLTLWHNSPCSDLPGDLVGTIWREPTVGGFTQSGRRLRATVPLVFCIVCKTDVLCHEVAEVIAIIGSAILWALGAGEGGLLCSYRLASTGGGEYCRCARYTRGDNVRWSWKKEKEKRLQAGRAQGGRDGEAAALTVVPPPLYFPILSVFLNPNGMSFAVLTFCSAGWRLYVPPIVDTIPEVWFVRGRLVAVRHHPVSPWSLLAPPCIIASLLFDF